MRLPKRRTNSCCSAGEALVHAAPSERCDISSKSKRLAVTLRIWARRSATEPALTAGPPGSEKTCCTADFTVSVGPAAVALPAAAATSTAIRIFSISSALPCREFARFSFSQVVGGRDNLRIQCRRPWMPGQNGRHDAQLVVATRGVWTGSERRAAAGRLRGLARRVTVISDAEAAHLGALGGRPGLLVLAGTGSIVLGRGANGRWVRAGGLGPLFGDGGSAFALGRDWLAAAHPSRARRLAQAPAAPALIAALAPRVLTLARRGRGPARLAVTRGAFALALFMRAAAGAARLSPPISVSWAGSLLENRAYRGRVWRMARGLGLRIAPVAPRESALEAAARLAHSRAR